MEKANRAYTADKDNWLVLTGVRRKIWGVY